MTTITDHRLVRRITDLSAEPLIGAVVGREDEGRLLVAWGDARHSSDVAESARVENIEDVIDWDRAAFQRARFTAGLRQLADILDANPDVPLPYEGASSRMSWGVHGTKVPPGKDVPEALVDIARVLIPGTRTKSVDDSYYRLHGNLLGLQIEVWGMRDSVCERVVTGTREVTKDVPDPDALAAVPTITVTETVEDVEWVCTPLLADSQVSA